ncbi:MAG: long-chain fatty acid--CoA ligase [Vicinamibacterales bacterium]
MTPDKFRTLADIPLYLGKHCQKPAILRRCKPDGFDDYSPAEVYARVRDLAVGLGTLGLEAGDRMALVSESRPEWTIFDFASLTSGAVTVPIYPTQSAEQMAFILNDAGAKIAVVSNEGQAQKVLQKAGELASLRGVVVIDGQAAAGRYNFPILTAEELRARGRELVEKDDGIEERYRTGVERMRGSDLATIVYTSGTTGEPKGVMLTHDNLLANARATREVITLSESDVALSFLPLSHVFERMLAYRALYDGVTLVFAESLSTVARDLGRVRPTLMTGVPRFYEKFVSAIHDAVDKGSAARKKIFRWAVGVGRAAVRAELAGRRPGPLLRVQRAVADRLVYRKIRERAGGRIRYFISGSAPLAPSVAEFFLALGFTILEGYGLTETSPVVTANAVGATRLGTVGRPLPGVEVRIEPDGEIATRGPNVMVGYYRRPDLTAEVIKDGWFYTGDVGRLDEDGYLTITDRKKDLIVTSGGKKIAPQPLESCLKADPLIAEAVVIGENRRFPAVLIVPDFGRLEAEARARRIEWASHEDLVAHPAVVGRYQEVVERLNQTLGQFERIKKFAVLPTEFTMERDELTPSMKVRRKVVEDRWKDVIERMYQ